MGAPVFRGGLAAGGLDNGLIARMRLVLSSSVLFIVGPPDLENPLGGFHVIAALYITYSALHSVFAERQIQPLFSKISYVADVSWAALLVTFSDESSTAFLFLFPIMIASFQWSFVAAICLTIIAAKLSVAIGLLQAQLAEDLQPQHIFLPPIYLLVFGYLVARWGDREATAKRRLMLLKEINRLSNPRFGIDRMIGKMMERLRAFYDAEVCLLIVANKAGDEHTLRCADRRDPEGAVEAAPIPADTAQILLAPPLDQILIYPEELRGWKRWRSPTASAGVSDVRAEQWRAAPRAPRDALVALVDAESFIGLPLRYADSAAGRLYLTSKRRRAFSSADVVFLLQVVEQIVPTIENIRLVDQLASSAAEAERRRLARDIHDSVIQSYVGFQIGLAAIGQKLHRGSGEVADDVARLAAIADQQVDTLRRYVHGLHNGSKQESVLLAAVHRFVATFTETTRIAVQVDAAVDLRINDRLVAEVFHMIVEGLSNIRRHTHATSARIGLACEHDCLLLRIANDDAEAAAHAHFMPWSIAERAAALGGQARVEHVASGTQVTVEIPL